VFIRRSRRTVAIVAVGRAVSSLLGAEVARGRRLVVWVEPAVVAHGGGDDLERLLLALPSVVLVLQVLLVLLPLLLFLLEQKGARVRLCVCVCDNGYAWNKQEPIPLARQQMK
jgi:hypothetical protein